MRVLGDLGVGSPLLGGGSVDGEARMVCQYVAVRDSRGRSLVRDFAISGFGDGAGLLWWAVPA